MIESKLFDTLLEPLFIFNEHGEIIYCNEPAALMVDVPARKIVRSKSKLTELAKFTSPIAFLDKISEVTDPTPYQEISFSTESGKTGRVQITFQKVNSEPPAWIMFFRDVTLEEQLQRKYRGELEQKEDVIRDLEKAQAKLEDYSHNLEKMVAERTAQLSALNKTMKALLDSLDQGFLIFDDKGNCLDVVSRACENILQMNPRGLPIWTALHLDKKATTTFQKWMVAAFEELLPFEDVAPLAPNRFKHPEQREISLSYYPLRNDQGKIEGIVLVATDVTNLVLAQREAEKEREYAKMVIQIIKQKKQVQNFIREAENLAQEITQQLEQSEPKFDETFRYLHTLKGGAASFSIGSIVHPTHEAEELLTAWNENKSFDVLTKFREHARQLATLVEDFADEFATMTGSQARNVEATREFLIKDLNTYYRSMPARSPLKDKFFKQFMLEPITDIFGHFSEVIQQVARTLTKNVAPLEIDPHDFAIFAPPYERLISTFVHAFRNAVDHGIEMSDDRKLAGKPTMGRIGIRCAIKDNLLRFIIWDDGGGINPAKIRERLDGKRIKHSRENDKQVIQHVFDSEFSTRDQVTALSGRGVGMDAIKAAAEDLGGQVWVESVPGKGSKLFVEVPWLTEAKRLKKAA